MMMGAMMMVTLTVAALGVAGQPFRQLLFEEVLQILGICIRFGILLQLNWISMSGQNSQTFAVNRNSSILA